MGEEKQEEKQFERIPPTRPGQEVLRRRRRPRIRLRMVPNVPAFLRFFWEIVHRTPLIQILSVLIVAVLLLALALYLVEGSVNEHLDSYDEALWWCITGMQTMGSPYHPVTAAGKAIGLLGVLVVTLGFWGTIIATVTAYFMLPSRRPSREIVGVVQYNLEKLDDLSLDELEVLKETTVGLIDARIEQVKETSSS